MWKGKVTQELKDLALKYTERFGSYVDGYDDIDPNAWTYEKFMALIKTALEEDLEIPDLLDF